jgi:phage terminase large subunit-like protein
MKTTAEYTVRKQDNYILVEDRDNGVAVAADVKAVVGQMRKVGLINDSSIIVLRDPFGKFDRVKPDGGLMYLDAGSVQEAIAAA